MSVLKTQGIHANKLSTMHCAASRTRGARAVLAIHCGARNVVGVKEELAPGGSCEQVYGRHTQDLHDAGQLLSLVLT
eukprot:scaffold81528_cov22-Tisochrysis_lutea.AAC.1